MWRRGIVALVLAAVAVTALAASMSHPGGTGPAFVAAAWSLPVDPWGPGQSFRCTGDGCGGDVRLYARTKSGFCNCFGGVADDDEIDRIGDVDMHGDDFTGVAPGQVTELAGLRGRARVFRTSSAHGAGRRVLSIVVAADCKAVVATLVAEREIGPDVERSARALLTGASFQQWVAAQ